MSVQLSACDCCVDFSCPEVQGLNIEVLLAQASTQKCGFRQYNTNGTNGKNPPWKYYLKREVELTVSKSESDNSDSSGTFCNYHNSWTQNRSGSRKYSVTNTLGPTPAGDQFVRAASGTVTCTYHSTSTGTPKLPGTHCESTTIDQGNTITFGLGSLPAAGAGCTTEAGWGVQSNIVTGVDGEECGELLGVGAHEEPDPETATTKGSSGDDGSETDTLSIEFTTAKLIQRLDKMLEDAPVNITPYFIPWIANFLISETEYQASAYRGKYRIRCPVSGGCKVTLRWKENFYAYAPDGSTSTTPTSSTPREWVKEWHGDPCFSSEYRFNDPSTWDSPTKDLGGDADGWLFVARPEHPGEIRLEEFEVICPHLGE